MFVHNLNDDQVLLLINLVCVHVFSLCGLVSEVSEHTHRGDSVRVGGYGEGQGRS